MSERREIKRDNAKGHKNSGRGKYQKGDASWKDFVVDYKEYEKSISISTDIWAKICTDTFKVSRDKHPLLKLILGKDNNKTRLAVIEWSMLEDLIKCWEENNEKI